MTDTPGETPHGFGASRAFVTGILLAILVLLGLWVLRPFVVPLVWAGILCFTTWPLYLHVTRLLKGRRNWSALLMTLLLTAAVILPTVLLLWALRGEAVNAFQSVNQWLQNGPRIPASVFNWPIVGKTLQAYDAKLAADPTILRTTAQTLFNNSYKSLASLLGDAGRNLVKLLLTILTAFFLYRDGDALAAQIRKLLQRLIGARVNNYLEATGATVKAVLVSMVLCAIAQGFLAGLGYWVAGVNAPVFAAALTAVAAMIPFAVPLVWGSVVVWLFVTGHDAAAIGLLIWCAAAVSWVDNLIRPIVISGATRIHFLLVMFGVLGGLGAFGFVGLFVGPAVFAVLAALWREWLHERNELAVRKG